jgi:hypothetical protein
VQQTVPLSEPQEGKPTVHAGTQKGIPNVEQPPQKEQAPPSSINAVIGDTPCNGITEEIENLLQQTSSSQSRQASKDKENITQGRKAESMGAGMVAEVLHADEGDAQNFTSPEATLTVEVGENAEAKPVRDKAEKYREMIKKDLAAEKQRRKVLFLIHTFRRNWKKPSLSSHWVSLHLSWRE